MYPYIFDPVFDRLNDLVLENIPQYNPDTEGLSWLLISGKTIHYYYFTIYGRQEMFERKPLFYIYIPPDCKTIYKHIYPYVSESQMALIQDAIREIAHRLPQIPLIKEKKCPKSCLKHSRKLKVS